MTLDANDLYMLVCTIERLDLIVTSNVRDVAEGRIMDPTESESLLRAALVAERLRKLLESRIERYDATAKRKDT